MIARARDLLSIAIAGGLLLAAGSAEAQNRLRAEAERRNSRANQLYQQGRYESALQMYQSAYDLVAAPKYLFNIGLAREKTFDYEGCAIAFQEFLRKTEESEDAQIRETARQRLEGCTERTEIPVRFTSVPTNAAIYLQEGDEKVLQGRTPQELELEPGEHLVRVELRGYVSQEQTIEVAIGKRPQADFVLEKLSSLRIEVDPAGSRIKIGEADWESAPVTRQVRAGTYEVRVKKEGYETARREVKVESGQEVSLVMSLRPLPKIRRLILRTAEPADGPVSVTIDGEPTGAPPVEEELTPGQHELSVSAPGHLPFAGSIRVPEDRDLELEVDLSRKRSRQSEIIFWSVLGAGGAAALTGSVYGILALSDQSSFDDDPTNLMLHERGQDRARKADLWLGTAALLGAGALVYYYVTRPAPSRIR